MDIEHYNGALAILRAAREHTTYRANGWMGGERTEITFFHHLSPRRVGTIRTKIRYAATAFLSYEMVSDGCRRPLLIYVLRRGMDEWGGRTASDLGVRPKSIS